MEKKYTVTYKVAPMGAKYVYQADKNEHKAGDVHSSSGGHMWYVINDGNGNERSYGFESVYDQPWGEVRVTTHDNAAYQQTSYEVTVALNESQYKKLIAFSQNPKEIGGFRDTEYSLHSNSCVDFVFFSLTSIGYNTHGMQGNLVPVNNIIPLNNMFKFNGAEIISNHFIRDG
ncbi:hypothetical protein [Xenorhabdus hominickii]|uniref:Serine protease n=1 Tax=Xenorhabdus hominickii TaxID=351679 RepID=A0A2G0Q1J1_XENHO|nr:hypothetical protein [Xenorhabdus hominickii]PHM53082.1 serine protease [Xenorhabdus hominickii]